MSIATRWRTSSAALWAALIVGCVPTNLPDEIGPSKAREGALSVPLSSASAGWQRMRAGASVSRDGMRDFTLDCNLDRVGDTVLDGTSAPELDPDERHRFTGWLVDPVSRTAGHGLTLVMAGVGKTGGTFTARGATRVANPGAAEVRGYEASMLDSSFAFDVDIGEVPDGTYHVYVRFEHGDVGAFCDPGRQVRVGR